MSSKYQREIEEILRNMDSDSSKSPLGDRVRNFQRPGSRRQGPPLSLTSLSLALVLLSVLFVLAATGIAFYENAPTLISGGFGLAAFVVFLLAMIVGWRDHFRASSLTPTIGRRPAPAPFADDNVVDEHAPRPIRRSFLDGLRTRVRLMRLRNRYRQQHDE